MLFFTPFMDKCPYWLLNVKHYRNRKKLLQKIVMIDPSVYDLQKYDDYPLIDQLHYLAQGHLLPNELLSIDYPSDMRPELSDTFIERSIQNNIHYKDNLQYIATVQFHIEHYKMTDNGIIAKPDASDFENFKRNYEYLAPIFEDTDKVLGIGNFCRIMTTNIFTDKVMDFLLSRLPHIKRVHFYGLAMPLIKQYIPYMDTKMSISVDSTKWTRAHSPALKELNGLNGCTKQTREAFLSSYLDDMRSVGIQVNS